MSGVPVVIAENGLGFPVRPVEANAPVMTIAKNGLGAPIVISDLGAPFIVQGLEPSPDEVILSWPEIIAWWDSGYTASGSSWADRKLGAAAVQATADFQPVYSATSFNGSPGLAFDGTNDRLVCTDPALLAALPVGAVPCEIWSVVQQSALAADTTQRLAISYGGNGFDTQRRLRRSVVSGVNRATLQVGDGAGMAPIVSDTVVDLSSRHLLHGAFGATSSALSVDGGTPVTVNAVPATQATRLVIGASSADTQLSFWQGIHRDHIICAPLSPEKSAYLQAFLMERRNI